MEESEIRKLLQWRARELKKRGWRCPDETKLASYATQNIDSATRTSVESHIADCDFCLSQLAFLTQSSDWTDAVNVPGNLLVKARNLVGAPNKSISWTRHWATAAALASLVLLVVAIGLQLRRQNPVLPPNDTFVAHQTSPSPVISPPSTTKPPVRSESRQNAQAAKGKPVRTPRVRNNTLSTALPQLIAPRDGALLRRDQIEFRWEPVSDAVFYEVRVMSADGDVVFEGRTEDIRLRPGSSELLIPETKYFVVIRAHLRQGKTMKSSLVSFRLAE